MNNIIFIDKYGKEHKEETIYDYEINETIRVNSNYIYKCIDIKDNANKKDFIFKEGIVAYVW